MATVRPPLHIAPPRPAVPPVAAPPLPPYAWRRTAADVDRGRKESVAESWCCPTEAVVADTAAIDDSDDDDGCGSCVDGASQGSAGLQELDEEASDVAWWRSQQESSSRCFLWPPNTNIPTTAARSYGHAGCECSDEEDDDGDSDPEVAAARRQEEDRKFWEACLASGYP